jgi:polysaccharide chain length determinant protein (PEP-CTERM system associated)
METLEFRQSSLMDFLHVIFKRKNHILLFFAVTVCAVVIGTSVIRPTYEAKAKILVKMGRENLYIPPSSTTSQIINFNRDNQINSEIELLNSRSLFEKVIKSLGPGSIYKNLDHKETVLNFQKSLSVEGIKKSDVIAVSFKHKDPNMAAKIVNTLADAYLDEHLLVHKNPQSYNFFEDQSQVLKTKLEQSQAALETFKKQNRVTALDEQQNLLLKQIADLNAALNQTLSQEAETRNRILQIRQQLDKTPETVPQGKEVDHNPFLISNLEAKLVELQLKEKELLIKYTPQSRLVKNVKEEIQMVQEKLAQKETKQYGKSLVGLNTTYQQLQEQLFGNQAEGKALEAKREIQKIQLTNCQGKLEQLNRMEVKLNQLEQSVDVNRQNYRLYLAKFEESRISDAMDNKKMANVSLMQPAFTPLKPVSPKVLLNIVLAIFLGGFGGLGLAFFREFLDDSLEKPEDVEKTLQLPVLASIPELTESDKLKVGV